MCGSSVAQDWEATEWVLDEGAWKPETERQVLQFGLGVRRTTGRVVKLIDQLFIRLGVVRGIDQSILTVHIPVLIRQYRESGGSLHPHDSADNGMQLENGRMRKMYRGGVRGAEVDGIAQFEYLRL